MNTPSMAIVTQRIGNRYEATGATLAYGIRIWKVRKGRTENEARRAVIEALQKEFTRMEIAHEKHQD